MDCVQQAPAFLNFLIVRVLVLMSWLTRHFPEIRNVLDAEHELYIFQVHELALISLLIGHSPGYPKSHHHVSDVGD